MVMNQGVSDLRFLVRAEQFLERTALKDPMGTYTYSTLLKDSKHLAAHLLAAEEDLQESRVGFMVRPGYDYVRTQWAIWRAGGIAVPICVTYPAPSIQYVLEDAQVSQVVAADEFLPLLHPICKNLSLPVRPLDSISQLEKPLPKVHMNRRAMILYTSGTTGRPKGVVSTHQSIDAQVEALRKAWAWQKEDHILNILPLHHVHGIINVLSCALWSGACCELLPSFHAERVFKVFERGEVNLFMAVPTIYYKLIAQWQKQSSVNQQNLRKAFQKFRLMVSGSAALPVSTLEKWRGITGQTLLERYGMTEMGMAISNPYLGERRPGYIGQPLPNVKVRLVDEKNQLVNPGTPGEIQVKGPNVFKEYWNRPDATQDTFTEDGWFKTGDIAQYEAGSFRILGRNSVDIIKSGGYKISALEIEEVLRKHPAIQDCGVVGVPDLEWGEIVAAGLVTNDQELDYTELKNWLKERLPGYKVPRKYINLEDLPRNVMGKVTKNELKKMFGS